MATEPQNEANRKNATASTGPLTPDGKSTSSRNAVSHGLFSTSDILHPGEQNEFTTLAAALHLDLAPEGALEQTLATEIIRAAWRLRRCAAVEDSLIEVDPFTDPMSNHATIGTQTSVDRARLQTHRLLQRSLNELRRLQNERRFRAETLPDDKNPPANLPGDNGGFGLTSFKDLVNPLLNQKRLQLLQCKLESLDSMANMLGIVTAPPETKRTQSSPAAPPSWTPRNAPCPCGSGQKHKRCCGQNAPAILSPLPNRVLSQAA